MTTLKTYKNTKLFYSNITDLIANIPSDNSIWLIFNTNKLREIKKILNMLNKSERNQNNLHQNWFTKTRRLVHTQTNTRSPVAGVPVPEDARVESLRIWLLLPRIQRKVSLLNCFYFPFKPALNCSSHLPVRE